VAIESMIIRLDGYVRIMPPGNDVEFYYAAADVYAGPSLEDTCRPQKQWPPSGNRVGGKRNVRDHDR
jgi:hypothetical protein